VIDAAGNLYGTTPNGGPGNFGIVFELSPGASGWTETILHQLYASKEGNQTDYFMVEREI